MTLALPRWAQKTYRTIGNMHVLPTGCLPNTPYLCFRSVIRDNGKTEKRCTMLIDFWGPDDCWNSPQLGDGVYCGLIAIPGSGPWMLSRHEVPTFNRQCLVYVPSFRHSLIHPVERGFYIGYRDTDGTWRVKLDSLARQKGCPVERRAAQIYDDGALRWLYLRSEQN